MRITLFLTALLAAATVFALEPATITITNLRDEAEGDASGVEFLRGYKLAFTNCIAYSGSSTSSIRQDLTGITMTLTVGFASSNTSYTATTQSATNGTWNCLITVPTNWSAPLIMLKLTDTNANTYVYPMKSLNTREPIK